MKDIWKYVLSVTGVAVVSASVSYAVVKSTQGSEGFFSSSGQSSLPANANEYGFMQVDNALISARTIGNAPDLSAAAESAVHSVVHIRVDGEQQIDQGILDPFEFFFGGGGGFGRPQSRPVTSFGSGVIISTDGYIITNNHVVENAKEISVQLNDNRSFKAKMIGGDSGTDIALLKIEAKDLPTIPFGNSDDIRLGEWVLAVGNPFNLTSTVTAGIISAKARSAGVGGNERNSNLGSFIQTDAAVNPGNSGGALVNSKGQLIGINTMIYSQTGNYAGYSFAVPMNTAAKVVSDIKNFGIVQRAVIGVIGGDVTPEVKEKYKLKVDRGAFIADFAEVSAAYAAGIEKEDVITHVDGRAIENMSQLQEQIGLHSPGDKIQLTVNRKGTVKHYTLTLKNSDGDTSVMRGQKDLMGAELRDISPTQMRSYGIRYGVEVVKVHGGLFKKAGIKNGFIILSVNSTPANKVEDVNKAINRAVAAGKKDRRSDLVIRGFYSDGKIRYYEIPIE